MSDSSQQIYTQDSTISILSAAVKSYNSLLQKDNSLRLDLETGPGQEAFKAYMENIQALFQVTKTPVKKRDFREQYTKAYRLLYNQSSLGYIPQIFDAAQQAYQCIWVNGQSFIFEPSTLEKGQKLVQYYFKLIQLIRLIYLHTQAKSNNIPVAYQIQLKQKLQQFDFAWIDYQQVYIQQLIDIEEKAKKKMIEAIQIEKNLTQFQNEQKLKGKIFYASEKEFNNNRRLLCQKISYFNSIANINGKGRDDLKYEILIAAQNILTKITDSQSKSLRSVAQKIRESFCKIREVLKNYAQNIELVDPQMRNNIQLVEALIQYEACWQKGKRYFLEQKKESQILAFSRILEASKEKYATFKQLLEYSDPSVFWMIVSVVVLSSLEGEDEGITQSFLKQIKPEQNLKQQYRVLEQLYTSWKLNQSFLKTHQLYNELEKRLVGNEESQNYENSQNSTVYLATRIKQFAISLERLNPLDWNQMLGVLLSEQE